tara:strand:- start:669 stop:800 length:132 start_codon:yes stop_codon:yes gene_type:complete
MFFHPLMSTINGLESNFAESTIDDHPELKKACFRSASPVPDVT